MPIRTKRINDPAASSDGTRILITRYRPRGVRRGAESWAAWDKRLAPSTALLDAYLGKARSPHGVTKDLPPITWSEFRKRFRAEMREPQAQAALDELRRRAGDGETMTLLCYCEDRDHCHRTLVHELLER